jgi:TRAP-type C4-dicarboxylate transport system permease small subunit
MDAKEEKTVFWYLFKLNELAAAVAFVSLCLVVFIQVVTRYLFQYSFPWAEEFPIFLFLWVSFLAASASQRENRHLGVTILADQLPSKFNWFAEYLNLIFSLIYFILLFYYELEATLSLAPSTFVVLKFSKAFCYVGIPVSCVFFALFIIEKIISQAKKDLSARKAPVDPRPLS